MIRPEKRSRCAVDSSARRTRGFGAICASEGDAALSAARELISPAVGEFRQANPVERLLGAGGRVRKVEASQGEGEFDVHAGAHVILETVLKPAVATVS